MLKSFPNYQLKWFFPLTFIKLYLSFYQPDTSTCICQYRVSFKSIYQLSRKTPTTRDENSSWVNMDFYSTLTPTYPLSYRQRHKMTLSWEFILLLEHCFEMKLTWVCMTIIGRKVKKLRRGWRIAWFYNIWQI